MISSINQTINYSESVAQPAHAADAATRPQDRRFFEGLHQSKRLSDLLLAARLIGNPLGGWAALLSDLLVI